MRIRSRRSLRAFISLTVFLTSSIAFAGGLDALQDAANEALKRGDAAQAVANLRRARQSILAEGNEDAILTLLHSAETRWLEGRVLSADKLPLDERPSALLSIDGEVDRIHNDDGKRAVKAALARTGIALWQRDAGVDDASAMAVATKLRNSFGKLPDLEQKLGERDALLRKQLAQANLPGSAGEFIRRRLLYALYLSSAAPLDPNPITTLIKVQSISNETPAFASALRKALESEIGSTAVEISFSKLEGKRTSKDETSRRSFSYEEPYTYMVEERVVRRETRSVQVGTSAPSCFPTYSSGSSGPTTVNGQQGWGTSYYQTGQNCYGGGQGIYEDREVETIDYVPKERKGTRTVYETVSVTKRTATYGSSVSAVIRVPGREINVTFDSTVEASDEAFSAPLSKHFAIFQDTNEANLVKEAAIKARNELQRFAKAAIRGVKADERRAALPAASEAEKAGILTELAVLESGVSSADVVDYLKATTKQSAATLALALNDKRIAIAPSYLTNPDWIVLPKPDADAERDAFVGEEREYFSRNGPGTSGSLYFGVGSTQFPGGPAFPYFSIQLGINKTPAFLLYRAFTGSGFLEVNGGFGHIFPVSGVVGLSLGARLGPVTLSGIGVGGGDVVFVNRAGDPESPNEPEVLPAPLLGYGARLQFKSDTIRFQAAVRKHHRFLQGPDRSYVGDFRVGYSAFYLGARYETYRDIFSGSTERQPWSFIGAIGVQADLNDTEVGELNVRK
jgi:hypothetical protein